MSSEHFEPADLFERIRLGQNALVGGLDPTPCHMPYFNCGFRHAECGCGALIHVV